MGKTGTINKQIKTQLFKHIILNVCGMLGLSGYILADTFFVSKGLGTNGLTALNLAIPVYSFIHGSGLMIGMGGGTKYSIFRGQKNYTGGNEVYTNSLCIAGILSVVFTVIGLAFSKELCNVLGADSAVFDMTHIYLKIILLAAPGFILNDIMVCFVRNDGNPGLSMTAMLAGSISNIILDYIFIFPLDMGMFGAVLATAMAPFIGLMVLSLHFIRRKNNFHVIKSVNIRELWGKIIGLGFPSLISEVASGVVMILFNTIILKLSGNIGVAAYGIIANLSLVVTAVYTGMAQGMQPVTSKFYGEGKNREADWSLKATLKLVFVISVIVYVLLQWKQDIIIEIFNSEGNKELIPIAQEGVKIYFTAIIFAGINIIIATFFSSTDNPLPAQIISLARGLIVIIPMAILMSHIFDMKGIWMSYPITEGLITVGTVIYIIKKRHRLIGKNMLQQ